MAEVEPLHASPIMVEAEPSLSLLDAVRTQLTIDSDSDSSQGTEVEVTLIQSKNESPIGTPTDTPLDESLSTNPSIVLVTDTTDLDPFPDFDQNLAEEHEECERNLQQAMHVAVREHIRVTDIDAAITTPPGQSAAKCTALHYMKDLLSDPHLSGSARKRFVALTNMIIRLHLILFSTGSVFLGMRKTADAAVIVGEMLRYFRWVDQSLQAFVTVAKHVSVLMMSLAEEDIPEFYRYRNMSVVVSTYLCKPRFLEQHLLSSYLDLFDEWIHNRFLLMSNRKILQEDTLDPAFLQLTNNLNELWVVLSRSVNNYAEYRERVEEMHRVYLLPTVKLTGILNPPASKEVAVEERGKTSEGA